MGLDMKAYRIPVKNRSSASVYANFLSSKYRPDVQLIKDEWAQKCQIAAVNPVGVSWGGAALIETGKSYEYLPTRSFRTWPSQYTCKPPVQAKTRQMRV